MSLKKVSLLVDHQVFSIQNYGGITAYYEWLLPELKKYKVNYYLPFLISSNFQISKIKKHIYLKISDVFVHRYFKYIYFLINSIYTLFFMKLLKYDVFHSTYFETYFLKFLGDKKLVVTVYDCAYEDMGDKQKWTVRILENRRKLINRADAIIAISNDVKKDILKYYKVDPKKIHVIYLFSPLGNMRLKKNNKFKKDNNILYIGTRKFNKNFTTFLKAFKLISVKNKSVRLLCLGGGKFTADETQSITSLGLTNKIDWKYISSDNETVKYLQKALMFVHPSLKEGFGIPLLNAFVCGCPVAASDIPVFNEIAENSFVKFDPTSYRSIYSAMDDIIVGKAKVNKYVANGYKCVNRYSVKRMVKETACVYKGLS